MAKGDRGHRLLPLAPPGRAQRGRRRPRPCSTTRARDDLHAWAAAPAAALAARDDHAVHPRHQAQRGRARPAARPSPATPRRWAALLAAAFARRGRRARTSTGPPRTCCGRRWSGSAPIAAERLHDYLVKAMREAKQRTAWIDGDADYEARVLALADRRPGPRRPARRGRRTAVGANAEAHPRDRAGGQAAAADACPGCRTPTRAARSSTSSLVDPDNRRAGRLRPCAVRAAGPAGRRAPARRDLDDEKLLVTSRALRLRRRSPEVFGERASYDPLPATSEHALGFLRSAPVGRVASALGLARQAQVAVLVTRAPHRLGGRRRLGRRHGDAARGAVARRAHRPRPHRRHGRGAPTCSADLPVALLRPR